MAVTITSQPTTPNVTGTKLLFEVTSSNISHPQYSYIMDVYQSGSSELISRALQTPNQKGGAVFDPSQIIYPSITTENIFYITQSVNATEQFKTFDIKFGEAYSTSESGSLTYYSDQSSGSLGLFNGTVNPNTGYNFPSQSFDIDPATYFYRGPWLTTIDVRDPNASVSDDYLPVSNDDYSTFTVLKQPSWQFDPFIFGAPTNYGIEFVGYDINDDIIVRAYLQPEFELIDEGLVHIPNGPQNLISSSFTYTSDSLATVQEFFELNTWYRYFIVNRAEDLDSPFPISFNGFPLIRHINEKYANYPDQYDPYYTVGCEEKLRFAFANEYGALEYFNCYGPLRRSSTVDRSIVSLPKVNYSDSVSTYSYENGGDFSYYRDTNDSYIITTPILGESAANWLSGLLESNNVFIQQGKSFVPIVITNTSYTVNTNENRQKVFTYNIEFVPSNGRIVQSVQSSAIPTPSPQPGTCDFVPIVTEKYDCE